MQRLLQLRLRHVIVEFNLHAYRPKRLDMMQLFRLDRTRLFRGKHGCHARLLDHIAQPALEHANDTSDARLGAMRASA